MNYQNTGRKVIQGELEKKWVIAFVDVLFNPTSNTVKSIEWNDTDLTVFEVTLDSLLKQIEQKYPDLISNTHKKHEDINVAEHKNKSTFEEYKIGKVRNAINYLKLKEIDIFEDLREVKNKDKWTFKLKLKLQVRQEEGEGRCLRSSVPRHKEKDLEENLNYVREKIGLPSNQSSPSQEISQRENQSVEEEPIEQLYLELEDMLRSNNWQEADQVTSEIIWRIAGTWQERSFKAEVSEKFPCEDLRTIDELWTKYSDGRFGFSVQRSIWQSSEVDKKIKEFVVRVGWGYLRQNDVVFVKVNNFSDNALKEGQLPWKVTWEQGSLTDRQQYLSRIVRCKI
jgi:hypothetical protein